MITLYGKWVTYSDVKGRMTRIVDQSGNLSVCFGSGMFESMVIGENGEGLYVLVAGRWNR